MYKWVVKKDGEDKFTTDYDSCIYPDDLIKTMIASGYKIYKDGKAYKPLSKNKKSQNVAD